MFYFKNKKLMNIAEKVWFGSPDARPPRICGRGIKKPRISAGLQNRVGYLSREVVPLHLDSLILITSNWSG